MTGRGKLKFTAKTEDDAERLKTWLVSCSKNLKITSEVGAPRCVDDHVIVVGTNSALTKIKSVTEDYSSYEPV